MAAAAATHRALAASRMSEAGGRGDGDELNGSGVVVAGGGGGGHTQSLAALHTSRATLLEDRKALAVLERETFLEHRKLQEEQLGCVVPPPCCFLAAPSYFRFHTPPPPHPPAQHH